MAHIVTATNDDDWEGVYVDGKLVAQGHRISARDMAGIIVENQPVESNTVRRVDDDWLYRAGQLPDLMAHVKWADEG